MSSSEEIQASRLQATVDFAGSEYQMRYPGWRAYHPSMPYGWRWIVRATDGPHTKALTTDWTPQNMLL